MSSSTTQSSDTAFADAYLAGRMRDPEFRSAFEAASAELAKRTGTAHCRPEGVGTKREHGQPRRTEMPESSSGLPRVQRPEGDRDDPWRAPGQLRSDAAAVSVVV